MTIAELQEAVDRSNASEEDLADELYEFVTAALERGEQREDVYASLKEFYSHLAGQGAEKHRRAVREVLGCFHGYCAPSEAL